MKTSCFQSWTMVLSLATALTCWQAPAVRSAEAHIEFLHDQVPTLSIDGRRQSLMHYFACPVKGKLNEELIVNCRNVGLHLYWLAFDVEAAGAIDWRDEGDYRFDRIDALLSSLVKADPQAYVMLTVPLDCVYLNSFRRWAGKYPDELARDEAGNTQIGGYGGSKSQCPSMASTVWLREAASILRGLIRHIRSGPCAERVIGYVPISGITGEWMYWGAQSQEFLDYSRPAQDAFQRWAKREYNEDLTRLNRSWCKQFASFNDIRIPTKDERLRVDCGDLLDPRKSRYVIDFHQYFSDVVANAIIFLCKAIKQEAGGRCIAGAYYGYTLELSASDFGHFSLQKVLESPDVDFLVSPSHYGDRAVGGASGFMGPEGSALLHKKLWISEADIRTLHSEQNSDHLNTLADSVAVLQREFARPLTAGCAVHWFDFGQGWIAKDTRLMQAVGRLQAIETQCLAMNRKTLCGQRSIAVIISERSVNYAQRNGLLHFELNCSRYGDFSRTGVGVNYFLMEDLDKIPEDYRCYVVEGALCITEKQKASINQRLKRRGNVVVWLYAPGIIDERKIDIENVREITGIKIGMQRQRSVLKVNLDKTRDGILTHLSGSTSYGSERALDPVFYAEDGEVLGLLAEIGKPGLVMKKFPEWTSIYSAAPNLPPALLRGIAQYAGLPVVNESEGDVTYVSDKLVTVHTVIGGTRMLNVGGRDGHVRELISGNEYTVSDGKAAVILQPRSTSIFLIE